MAQIYLPERTEEQNRPQRSPIPSTTREQRETNTGPQAAITPTRQPHLADVAVIVVLVGVVALIIAAAGRATAHSTDTVISLSPAVLPLYAGFSLLRMVLAYILSLTFTLVYGHVAATSLRARSIMVSLLDILQSIPILSFLPGVVLALIAIFPNSSLGVEISAIILIFTSQAWNMTFSFYHSVKTLPLDLQEAATVYRLSPWRRFTRLELPFGMLGLVWNSMMSWAGGWFFLMAAEQLTLGNRSFRLPGIGSYLQTAANRGSVPSLILGLGTLVLLIILLDLFIWRPVVAWSDKFKFEQTKSSDTPESPVLDFLRRSALLEQFTTRFWRPFMDRVNLLLDRIVPGSALPLTTEGEAVPRRVTAGTVAGWVVTAVIVAGALFGVFNAVKLLAQVSVHDWGQILLGGLLTFLRTVVTLALGLAWTLPLGVVIGTNPKWSRRLQPVVQVVASIPATALFPILLIGLLRLPAGIEFAAILLMLLGTQWYMLFNIIAGASSIPNDLREAARVYQVTGWRRWKTLILPCVFPYLVTGLITASGGAWNASVVAEFVQFNGKTHATLGLGSLIAQSAANNHLAVLLASTIFMAAIVVTINRLVWRRMYNLADRKYALG
ncbi:MAG: ABC transporter permease subunit [Ktedonobacterales bacterium]|nr:ABC transporter permease subunit [Ktedonobacterales bacterium]